MWRDAYLDGRILSADPLELVCMLYDYALAKVEDARRHLAAKDIRARGRAVTQAIAAIDELDASLNRQIGGSISRNLAALYQYMRLKLLEANSRQEDAPLAEVESLLRTLAEAWNGIRPKPEVAASDAAVKDVPRGFGAFAAEPQAEYADQGWSA